MLPEDRDAAYLWDMREAARDVVQWIQAVDYEEFCNNEMLHSAVERKLEVFGEAAGRVSMSMQEAHAEIPWKDIKGIRVILAHKYAEIELGILWAAAKNELPKILPNLDRLIPPLE